MKLVKKISLILAGVILLLHSVLPHEHHSELNPEEHLAQHQAAKGLLDFIKLSFHIDQGEDHLEKYQRAYSSFLFQALPADELLVAFHPVDIRKSVPPSFFQESLHSRFLSSQLRFRGPPYQA